MTKKLTGRKPSKPTVNWATQLKKFLNEPKRGKGKVERRIFALEQDRSGSINLEDLDAFFKELDELLPNDTTQICDPD